MTQTNQLSSGVITQSLPVVWLPNAKVTTSRRKQSGKSRNAAKHDFQASLIRIANSQTTVWHDFAQVCEAAGL